MTISGLGLPAANPSRVPVTKNFCSRIFENKVTIRGDHLMNWGLVAILIQAGREESTRVVGMLKHSTRCKTIQHRDSRHSETHYGHTPQFRHSWLTECGNMKYVKRKI